MDLTHLKTIKWFSLTVFEESDENLVVLECRTKGQAIDFMNILLNYDFSFSIDRSSTETHKLIITFAQGDFRCSIVAKEEILSKYFATKQINVLTTGFDINGGLACLTERLPIKSLHIFNLN